MLSFLIVLSFFSFIFFYLSQWFFFFLLSYSQLRSVIKKRSEDIKKLEKRINEIVDRIYKDFSASVGVKNIREYEENQLQAAQEMSEKRLSLSTKMSKLKYQYVFSTLFSCSLPFVHAAICHIVSVACINTLYLL